MTALFARVDTKPEDGLNDNFVPFIASTTMDGKSARSMPAHVVAGQDYTDYWVFESQGARFEEKESY